MSDLNMPKDFMTIRRTGSFSGKALAIVMLIIMPLITIIIGVYFNYIDNSIKHYFHAWPDEIRDFLPFIQSDLGGFLPILGVLILGIFSSMIGIYAFYPFTRDTETYFRIRGPE